MWLRLIGGILLALNAVACVDIIYKLCYQTDRFNGFISSPIAIEMVRCGKEIETVRTDIQSWLTKKSSALTPDQHLCDQLWWDYRFIIPIYWTVLLIFSALLYRHRFPFAKGLGLAAALCVTAAAFWDYVENNRIVAALSQKPVSDALAQAVLHAARWKWGLVFVTVALVATMFLWRRDWVLIIGAVYLLGALIGLLGLRHFHLIGWAIALLMAGGAGLGALWLFAPERFKAGLS